MFVDEKRLFHRYPSGLRVAFRVGPTGYRGRVVNVGAGGGFVTTKAPPAIGSRIQMAAQVDRTQPSVWLDLRVTWVVPEATDESQLVGFGGFWLHASSRYGEGPLKTFLTDVLGITRSIIRPMTPPSGSGVVHVYRFPDLYDGGELEELPWWGHRMRHPPRRPMNLASTPEVNTQEMRHAQSAEFESVRASQIATRKPPAPAPPSAPQRPPPPSLDDPLPVPASLGQNTGVFFADVLDELEPALSSPSSAEGPPPPVKDEGKRSLLDRIKGFGRSGDSVVKPLPKPVTTGLPQIEYLIGRKANPAALDRIGTGWVVFKAAPGTKAPEVWSRLVVSLKPPVGQKGEAVEVHATVTRVKEQPEGHIVHCKVNRVEEKTAGLYNSYVETFNAKHGGS